MNTQAVIEHLLETRIQQMQNGTLSLEQLYGQEAEWTLQLGVRKALLHPGIRQWLWYDRLHDEWIYTGCGIHEAILLVVGRTLGLKRLPKPGPVEEWCLYRHGEDLTGPLRPAELHQQITSGSLPPRGAVWTPCATEWLGLAALQADSFSLYNANGVAVLRWTANDGLISITKDSE